MFCHNPAMKASQQAITAPSVENRANYHNNPVKTWNLEALKSNNNHFLPLV